MTQRLSIHVILSYIWKIADHIKAGFKFYVPGISRSLVGILTTCLLLSCHASYRNSTRLNIDRFEISQSKAILQSDADIIIKLRKKMRQDLFFLAADEREGRKGDSLGHNQAVNFIARRFQETQLLSIKKNNSLADYAVPFSYKKSGINVIGLSPSALKSTDKSCLIVVTAHYDHLGTNGSRVFNGADDNASGVSAMLYLAARLQQHPVACDLMFVATDWEEAGLYGSKALFQDRIITAEKVTLNINIDMVGRRGNLFVGGSRSFGDDRENMLSRIAKLNPLFEHSRLRTGHDRFNERSLGDSSFEKIDWRKASDHDPFRRRKIRWLFFSDSPHADYHKITDDAERINYDYLNDNAEAIFQLVRSLFPAK